MNVSPNFNYQGLKMLTMRPPHKSPRNFYVPVTNNDGLKIPKEFTMKCRENILLNDVFLVVSDDKTWQLGRPSVTCDGNIWLQKGWPEFAQHYCLKIGHLLSFTHLGKSVFHVRIFEETYLEPIKFLETDPSLAQDEHIMSPITFQDNEVETQLSSENKNKHRSTRYKALEAAKAFMANNPNSYILELKRSFSRTTGLHIPMWFLKRYLISNEGCVDCVLEVSNGRKWGPIKCKNYDKSGYAKMYGDNVKLFRDENHLVVGDVCVFEMVNETEKVMNVTIFRACGNNSS